MPHCWKSHVTAHLLLLSLLCGRGLLFGHCFVMQYLVSLLYNFAIILHFCFTLIAFWCHVTVSVLWLLLAVPLVALQCVIVAFTDHTHLLLKEITCFCLKCGLGLIIDMQSLYPNSGK